MRHCPRLLFVFVLLIAVASIGCGKKNPVEPKKADPRPVLARIAILNDDESEAEDKSGTQGGLIEILDEASYEVTDLGLYYLYEGRDFSEFDLVFLLMGEDYSEVVPEDLQQALLDFMFAGGTLVTTEWLVFNEENDLLDPVLPLAYNDGYCDDGYGECIDTIQVDLGNHPLVQGLPSVFQTPWDYSYSFLVLNEDSSADNVEVLLTGDNAGALLGIGEWGKGTTIHWNNGGVYAGQDIWDENMTTILLNIADFAR